MANDAKFNFYINRQGPRGQKGEKGDQGFSPSITVNTDTADEYTLLIQNEYDSFVTDNIRPTYDDRGGTYVRVDRANNVQYFGSADIATTANYGEVKLAQASDLASTVDVGNSNVITVELLKTWFGGQLADNLVTTTNNVTIQGQKVFATPTRFMDTVRIGNRLVVSQEDTGTITFDTDETGTLIGTDATFKKDVRANGNVLIDGNLNVSGATSLSGNANIFGALDVKNGLTVQTGGVKVQGGELDANGRNTITKNLMLSPGPLKTVKGFSGFLYADTSAILPDEFIAVGDERLPLRLVGTKVLANGKDVATADTVDAIQSDLNIAKQDIIEAQGDIDNLQMNKQNKLTAGTGITIDADNVISATGGVVDLPIASSTTLGGIKVGENLTISEDGTLSATGGSTGDVSAAGDNTFTGENTFNGAVNLNGTNIAENLTVNRNLTSSGEINAVSIKTTGLRSDDIQTTTNKKYLTEADVDNQTIQVVDGKLHASNNIFDISKFTVVGSPTITDDGVASGFSLSNVLRSVNTFAFNNKPFEITLPVYWSSSKSQGTPFHFSNTEWTNYLDVMGDKIAFYLFTVDDGTATQHVLRVWMNYDVPFNDGYLMCSIKFDGAKYTLRVWNDEFNFTRTVSYSTSNLMSSADNLGYLDIGAMYRVYNGGYYAYSIDLKQFSITVDGEEVFSGLMSSTKPIYDAIKASNTELSEFKTETSNDFSAVNSALYEKANLSDLALKQDKLTAGTGITIDADNVISATSGGTPSDIPVTGVSAPLKLSGDTVNVPEMTGQTTDGFTVTASRFSATYSKQYYKCFNADGNGWYAGNQESGSDYIQIVFPRLLHLRGAYIKQNNNTNSLVSNYTLLITQNGTDWTEVLSDKLPQTVNYETSKIINSNCLGFRFRADGNYATNGAAIRGITLDLTELPTTATLGYDDNFVLDDSNQLSLNSAKFGKLSSPILDVPVNNCVLAMPTAPTFDGTNVKVYTGTKVAIPNGLNADGTCKSNIVTLTTDATINQSTFNGDVTLMLKSDGTIDQIAYSYFEVDDISTIATLTAYCWYYDRKTNNHYLASSTGAKQGPYQRIKIGSYNQAEAATTKYFRTYRPIALENNNGGAVSREEFDALVARVAALEASINGGQST